MDLLLIFLLPNKDINAQLIPFCFGASDSCAPLDNGDHLHDVTVVLGMLKAVTK